MFARGEVDITPYIHTITAIMIRETQQSAWQQRIASLSSR